MEYYKLIDEKVVGTDNIEEVFGKKVDRQIANTVKDGVRVSTIFLGIDHSLGGGPPLLFETMIFGGEHDQDQWRHATYDEAEKGHKLACIVAGILSEEGK